MSETVTARLPQHEQVPPLEDWGDVYRTIEGLGLAISQEERAEQLSMATGEGLLNIAIELHTVLAPDVSHEPTEGAMHIESPDGSNRRQLLDPSERAELFDYAAGLIRELSKGRGIGNDEGFLKRAANISALSVVLAHSFSDANGRTARTLAHIIREGYNGDDGLRRDIQTVGSNRPASGFRINSFVPTKDGLNLSPRGLLDAAASVNIPLEQREEYSKFQRENFTTPYTD